MKKRSAPAGKFGFPTGALFCLGDGVLPHLCHEAAHCLGCFILFLAGGVSVCPQGESCVVVPQHGGHGFDVHAVLEGQGSEGVPEIMEPEMLQPGIFEDALVEGSHRVRMVHTSGAGGREEPGVTWVLGVFLHEQIYRFLWDGDLTDGVLGFGAGDHVPVSSLEACLLTEMVFSAIFRSSHRRATSSPFRMPLTNSR